MVQDLLIAKNEMCIFSLFADTETLQTSRLRSATDNIKKRDLESTVTPVNTNTSTKEARAVSSMTKESSASTITQSYDTIKRKDNILSSTNNEVSTKDMYQSKSTAETRDLKAPIT